MDSLIRAIATGLDAVEYEIFGASTNHGKRIAVLCIEMGKALGKSLDENMHMANCALLHDNALTESYLAERSGGHHDPVMKEHCICGQRNIGFLCRSGRADNLVLYHHERADGNGPFGIRAGEGPLAAELIAIADSVDVTWHLQRLGSGDLASVRQFIAERAGTVYSKAAAGAMLEILDWPAILSLRDDAIHKTAEAAFAPWYIDAGADECFGMAKLITKIIDYKSAFTRKHSAQIANRAWYMGGYLHYDEAKRIDLFLAASFHDIGKLKTPTAILEKPGKLSNEEFLIIKEHVYHTWEMLKDIEGFELICAWASNHHEKLNGAGYPFGKKAEELDYNSRLMACIDVYQAVSEERPYHPARNHSDTMQILYKMADSGGIDRSVADDLSLAFMHHDGRELPPPEAMGT